MAVFASQAIATYNSNHSVSAPVVSDMAANLLVNLVCLQTFQTAKKLTSVQLTGTSNAVTAAHPWYPAIV
jgi:hypothetical protein